MRLIDADELKKCVLKWLPQDPCGKEEKEMPFETDICVSMLMEIDEQPTIQPEIIYCGDGCKFWNRHAGEQAGTCDILRQCTSDNFYCGNAKRKEK